MSIKEKATKAVINLIPDESLERMLAQVGAISDPDYVQKLVALPEVVRSAMGLKAKYELEKAEEGSVELMPSRVTALAKLVSYVQEAELVAGTANKSA